MQGLTVLFGIHISNKKTIIQIEQAYSDHSASKTFKTNPKTVARNILWNADDADKNNIDHHALYRQRLPTTTKPYLSK